MQKDRGKFHFLLYVTLVLYIEHLFDFTSLGDGSMTRLTGGAGGKDFQAS